MRCEKHGGPCSRKIEIDESSVPPGASAISAFVGGSACTDYSFYGNHQYGAGPTAIYLLIMLRIIAEYKPHIVLHENVILFSLQLIAEVLEELYEFEQVVLQPDVAGWPVERKRKYIIGRLRLKLKCFGVEKNMYYVCELTFLFVGDTHLYMSSLPPRLYVTVDTFMEECLTFMEHIQLNASFLHTAQGFPNEEDSLRPNVLERNLTQL